MLPIVHDLIFETPTLCIYSRLACSRARAASARGGAKGQSAICSTCRISSWRSVVGCELGDLQTAYLRARGLSPLGAAEGAGRPRPVRNISKPVTPMPSCRAIGSGPLDCSRSRSERRVRIHLGCRAEVPESMAPESCSIRRGPRFPGRPRATATFLATFAIFSRV